MIRSFTIENFCSFRHPTAVSFVVGKNAPENTTFRDSIVPDERLSVVLGIFGPNASGKTNLLKGLPFLAYFILHSYDAAPETAIPVDGFLPLGPAEPTRIELEYEADGTLFRYKVEFSKASVLSETLSRRAETGRFGAILQRQMSGTGARPVITIGEALDIPKDVLQNTLRDNASIVSTALQTGNETLRRWVAPLAVTSNVSRFGRASNHTEARLIGSAATLFHRDLDLFGQMSDLIQRGDLGIKQLAIIERPMLDEDKGTVSKQLSVQVAHAAGDLPDFALPLLMESTGTKRLFILLSWILPALREGHPAVIDELESDLHPHMIPWILRLFTTPAFNPKNAQLFFTCHSVEMLNELDKTQTYLVGKDPADNISIATRLDTIKGVRRNDNIFAKYNAGTYGAVPEPS
ncbi:MAG: ATP-binding protein [Verrucomicrobia bacterium]|nr:ATP-binding protein [Verrucomicrobiota bacterium]